MQQKSQSQSSTPKPKATPKRKAGSPEAEDTPTPRKKVKKEPPKFSNLEVDKRAAAPVDVAFEGEFIQAIKLKSGKFGSIIKLEAPNAFSLVKTVRCAYFTCFTTMQEADTRL